MPICYSCICQPHAPKGAYLCCSCEQLTAPVPSRHVLIVCSWLWLHNPIELGQCFVLPSTVSVDADGIIYLGAGISNIMAYSWPSHCKKYLEVLQAEKHLLKKQQVMHDCKYCCCSNVHAFHCRRVYSCAAGGTVYSWHMLSRHPAISKALQPCTILMILFLPDCMMPAS